jgi:predicted secreted protein
VALLAAYAGVLPCADCAGIRTELRLFADQASGQAVRYELTETYLGTRDGDRRFERSGRWTVLRGTPDDNDATVYQLDSDQPGRARNFLRVGDAELRVLGRDQRPIASAIPQSLQRMADNDAVTPLTLVEKDAGQSVEVKRGQTVIVRLDSNRSTGYRWTLIEPDSPVLTSTGAAVYEERAVGGPVGANGTETWSFVVAKNGEQELVFEYRRPWESDLPAARRVSYTVRAVR